MDCICFKTPIAIYYENLSMKLKSSLEEVATGEWIKLFRCKSCGQHWSVDEYDKYVDRVAIKIDDVENWERYDTVSLRKKLLLEERGGTQDIKCMWSGCDKKCVKDMSICIDHLWKNGVRK